MTDSWERYAQNVVGNQYGGQDIYGSPYSNQGMYGGQGAYAGQNAYNNQQMQQNVPPQNIPAPKVASHPNGFGVQEEPEIDFSDL